MTITRRAALGAALVMAAAPAPAAQAAGRMRRAFVGCFTYAAGDRYPADFGQHADASRGVYSFAFDTVTGQAGPPGLAAEIRHPANLIPHVNGRALYACQGQEATLEGQNAIAAFATDGPRLKALNIVPSGGGGPTHGVVDRTGRNLLTTNFATSSVVCFRLAPDGSIGQRTALIGNPPKARLPAPGAPGDRAPAQGLERGPAEPGRTKPHIVILSPSQRYAVVAEIDVDRCAVYRFDAAAGTLTPHSQAPSAPGAGPRHLAFERTGRFLYSSDEGDSSITAWRWNEARGEMAAFQRLPTTTPGLRGKNHPAHVGVHPSGRFVYVSNRGAGTIAGFRIDPRDGRLTPIGETQLGAPASWCFDIDPSGRWMIAAMINADALAIFAIDPSTGALTPTGQRVAVTMPTCVRMI